MEHMRFSREFIAHLRRMNRTPLRGRLLPHCCWAVECYPKEAKEESTKSGRKIVVLDTELSKQSVMLWAWGVL